MKLSIFKAIHYLILINFVVQIVYATYMIFYVITPEGSSGAPLFGGALDMPIEKMVTRRLYAIEFWIAFSGFSVYFALTEILPRLKKNG